MYRDDWTKFTDYRGYEKTDQVIEWFWQCIRSWPAERKSRLLQFTTGTSRVPVNGFKDLQGSDGPRRFTIEKSGDPQGLPRSHTCFNRLDLPPYQDYESLESKLLFAIECAFLYFHNTLITELFLQGKRKGSDRSRLLPTCMHCSSTPGTSLIVLPLYLAYLHHDAAHSLFILCFILNNWQFVLQDIATFTFLFPVNGLQSFPFDCHAYHFSSNHFSKDL